jgi:hypothetical protein
MTAPGESCRHGGHDFPSQTDPDLPNTIQPIAKLNTPQVFSNRLGIVVRTFPPLR